ncbi:MAG: Type 1 glutamine amidotransferase-like domain-containing protein [Acidobacteriota bacterium]
MRRIIVLGPQRLQPILGRVIDSMSLQGRFAVITAGWQEREQEDDEIAHHLGGRTVNLDLFQRGEEVLTTDAELALAIEEISSRRHRAHEIYRLRLNHLMAVVWELMSLESPGKIAQRELDDAFESVRALDRRHIESRRALRSTFARKWEPNKRPTVARHRREIGQILADCEVVAIAGGHVETLVDHLRVFGMEELWEDRPILCWSAGAMALAETFVLFHDVPPQGFGHAEALDEGLALFPRVLPMPHARRRLNLDDRRRVTILARRFANFACVPLDEGDHFEIRGAALWAEQPMRRITTDGDVITLEANPS